MLYGAPYPGHRSGVQVFCPECSAAHHVQRGESLEMMRCSHPGCPTEMCGECLRRCEHGAAVCEEHWREWRGLVMCPSCVYDAELDCTCELFGDRADAEGCDLHSAASAWHALYEWARGLGAADAPAPDEVLKF